jgi:hypothetical protein
MCVINRAVAMKVLRIQILRLCSQLALVVCCWSGYGPQIIVLCLQYWYIHLVLYLLYKLCKSFNKF